MVWRPARRVIPKKGTARQAFTSVTQNSARSGFVSQGKPVFIRPRLSRIQLITLKFGVNIHCQARPLRTVGTIQGSRIAARISLRNGIVSLISRATPRPIASFRTVAPAGKMRALRGRKGVVRGKGVDLGGGRILKKKTRVEQSTRI